LAKLLSQSQAEVVHAHWTYEFAMVALESGKPTVVTAHDAPMTVLRRMPDAYRLVRTAMAWNVRLRLNRLTAVSPYLADQWRKQMMFRGEIAVIPNAAPQATSHYSYRERTVGSQNILCVGDATRRKNVRTLLSAFALVQPSYPDIELELAGPGLHEGGLIHRWAQTASLSVGVHFHGRVERHQIDRMLTRADVLAHPSLEECHPMAVIEAMAAGVPVVAGAKSGGVPWTLGDGSAGLLVDVTSAEALADGIRRLLSDIPLQRRLREAAAFRAEEMFSPEKVARQYIDEYERAMRVHGHSR
jgi:glycosyltransferase involved in cell wall biosynthesis